MSQSDDEKSAQPTMAAAAGRRGQEPVRIRLPGFIDDEIGLGQMIQRITSSAGIRPCGGCRRRAAALDRWLVFTPWRRG